MIKTRISHDTDNFNRENLRFFKIIVSIFSMAFTYTWYEEKYGYRGNTVFLRECTESLTFDWTRGKD